MATTAAAAGCTGGVKVRLETGSPGTREYEYVRTSPEIAARLFLLPLFFIQWLDKWGSQVIPLSGLGDKHNQILVVTTRTSNREDEEG